MVKINIKNINSVLDVGDDKKIMCDPYIFVNDIFSVKRNVFEIKIQNENERLVYESICFLFHNSYILDSKLVIIAEELENLCDYMKELEKNGKRWNYKNNISLIKSIDKQINYLKDKNYGFYGLDMNSIIVINKEIFLIYRVNYLLRLYEKDENNNVMYCYDLDMCPFFSCEEVKGMKELNKIPFEVCFESIYVSVGLLLLFCINNDKKQEAMNIILKRGINEKDVNILLKSVCHTKCYWVLRRCLNIDRKKRNLILL